jgi:glycosyltransferase involved in cell wall biosynthesis
MDNGPFISVLMTCYNREKYITDSILSVLESTYKNFELIIIDDCSTDSSLLIAENFRILDSRIRIIKNEKNLGDYRNRNNAVVYARHEYFTFVDSDDIIFKHTLQTMAMAIITFPDQGAYIMTRDHDDINKVSYLMSSSEAFYCHFFIDGFLETGPLGTLLNKTVFELLGGFSERRMTSDIDFFLRVTLNGPIVRLPSNLGYWRSHDNQESNHGFEYYLLDMILIYKNIFNSLNFPLKRYKHRLLFNLYFSKVRDVLFYVYKTREISNLKYLLRIIRVNEFVG